MKRAADNFCGKKETMGKPYSQELDGFAKTYSWAERQNVEHLRHFLNRWSGDHAVVVGSGGSYSAAYVVALFREIAHHSPTTAATPLEFFSLIERLSPRTLLISAEGKNNDILAAASAAEAADLATAAITLTPSNPLVDLSRDRNALRSFSFQMDWHKDGYLATNSLLATLFLLYRAFFGDSDFKSCLGPVFDPIRLASRREQLRKIVDATDLRKRGLIVLYSIKAKSFAIDLESKISEAALTTVQITDLRQFAHGRHLQLTCTSRAPYVLVVSTVEEQDLALATAALLPDQNLIINLKIDDSTQQDAAVFGMIDAMYLVESFSKGGTYDPGQPVVPEFGKAIHALNTGFFLTSRQSEKSILNVAVKRKTLAGKRSANFVDPNIYQAGINYINRLCTARIRAVVCDFDGTLCRTENRFEKMNPAHVEQISTLIRQGLGFAIATGRGDSLHESLRSIFDPELHGSITVGYYSGSYIAQLSESFEQHDFNPEFAKLWTWLEKSMHSPLGKPLVKLAHGGQFSMRLESSQQCSKLRDAISAWLFESNLRDWRVFCSGHSIDVLDSTTSKDLVVENIAKRMTMRPEESILCLGDSGREDGNDFELLNGKLSLSCDTVSSNLDSCWNFGFYGNNQTEVTMQYLRALTPIDGVFKFTPTAFQLHKI